MKKLLSIKTLGLLLACLSWSIGANAYDISREDVNGNTIYYNLYNYYYDENTHTANDDAWVEVTYASSSYNSYSGNVVIPQEALIAALWGIFVKVEAIGQYAFRDCYNLNSISMPVGLKTIGQSAFSYCTSLTSVTIPYTVTRIEYNAFGDCSNLRTAYIGSGVTYIGSYGFDSPLTRVEVYSSTPPTINNQNAFKTSTYNDGWLIVPEGCVSRYKNATHWSNFAHIRSRNAIPINSSYFPDANFRSALLALYPDGYISDIANITELDVHNKGISNLSGISYFTGLEKLICYNNSISSLDVSSNTKLTYLDCDENNMTYLNVNNTKLTYLDCGPNKLTSINGIPNTLARLDVRKNSFTSFSLTGRSSLTYIDISDCTSLTDLRCYNNALTQLDVSGCTSLTYLDCAPNPNLSYLRGLSDCTAMKNLYCYETSINDLSAVSGMSRLELISCHDTKLTSLELSNKSYLTEIRAYNNPYMTSFAAIYDNSLTTIDIKNCTALTEATCHDNALTSLNVTGNTALKDLRCFYNYNLASITGLANCTAITYLDCEDCAITSLPGVNSMNNIETLWCRNNKLTTLEVTHKNKLVNFRASGNTSMNTITCTYCPLLTDFDISNCTSLSTLYCFSNAKLAAITGLATCTALATVQCQDCIISSLPVSGLSKLQWLSAGNNKLTSLTLPSNSVFYYLSCDGNQLTSLNLTGVPALKYLYCYDNLLTSISFASSTPNLQLVNCSNNKFTTFTLNNRPALTTLNIKNNTLLTDLRCYDNALTTLNITGNTALKYLDCAPNNNLTAITGLADCKAIEHLACYRCALTDLSAVNSMTNLNYLSCEYNKLTSLTVTNKSKLTTVYCENNPNMTTLTVTGNPLLASLYADECPALTTLYAYSNALANFFVASNTALKDLRCYGNANLASIIGIGDCKAIQKFYCYNCALTDLSAAVSGMTNIDYLSCYGNKLTSLTVQNKSKLTYLACYNNPSMTSLTVTGNSALKTLDTKNCTALTSASCYNNALTTLSVTGNTKMTTLYCYNNQLTSLSLTNCTALKTLYCYKNKISGTGMNTLVNTLPTRTASNPGTLRVIYNSGENNTMTAAQVTTATNKYWKPKMYNGSTWVDYSATLIGDVDNDGKVNIDDVTALIHYLLTHVATGINLTNADVDPDGIINIDDLSALIGYLLRGGNPASLAISNGENLLDGNIDEAPSTEQMAPQDETNNQVSGALK